MFNRETFAEEKEKLKPMTWKERISYLFSYYNIYLILFLFLLVFLIEGGRILYRHTFYDAFTCVFANETHITEQEKDLVNDEFRGFLNLTDKKAETTFDTSLRFDDPYYAQASFVKLTSLHSQNMADVFITTDEIFESYATSGLYEDLNASLPDDIKDSLKDRFVYAKDADGNETAMGIKLDHSPLSEKLSLEENSCLIILSFDSHKENMLKFIRFSFGL